VISLTAAPEAVTADFSKEAPVDGCSATFPGPRPGPDQRPRRRNEDRRPPGHLRDAACLRIERWTWRGAQAVTSCAVVSGDLYN